MSQYHPVRFVDVRLEGDFWKERLDTVLARTIPSQHKKLGEYGLLDSLKLPNPPPPLRFPRHANGFTVQVFWDSDVGKWIEAAAYALSHKRDADIEAKIEAIVDDFEKAQAPDGYLNCWYLGREPEKRWSNLRDNHELYNAGHMLEGAIAYYETTGRRRWLDIMERSPGFAAYLWDFVEGKPIINRFRSIKEIPAETELSRAVSKDLKARGFKFCGPTIVYAFMQATGMVNDHLVGCPRHEACKKLGRGAR